MPANLFVNRQDNLSRAWPTLTGATLSHKKPANSAGFFVAEIQR